MNYREKAELVADAVARFEGGSGEKRINCPVCVFIDGKADYRACLGVNLSDGWFHCHKCKLKGRLAGYSDGFRDYEPEEPTPSTDLQLPEDFTELFTGPSCYGFAYKRAREYVLARVSPSIAKIARIGACLRGEFASRVIIPVYDPADRLSWYVGRTWANQNPKYRYPRGHRKSVLYNEKALYEETTKPVLLVEGCFDALGLWPDAVAVLGKPTLDHLEVLRNARRPIAVCLDGDAHEEGWAFSMKLQMEGIHAGSIRLPPKADPDEVDQRALWEAAHECTNAKGQNYDPVALI